MTGVQTCALPIYNANTHWVYPTSVETDALLDQSRSAAADFLNATVSEVAFGNNMTTLTFHLARALGSWWGPGDEVVITDLDHHANVAPWKRLERERGITVRHVKVNLATGQVDFDSLASVLGKKTKLLAIGAGSNALGTILPVAEIISIAHGAGIPVLVDGAQAVAHMKVDLQALDADFYVFSGHKLYGPDGIGILNAASDIVWLSGAASTHSTSWLALRHTTPVRAARTATSTGAFATSSPAARRRRRTATPHRRGNPIRSRYLS